MCQMTACQKKMPDTIIYNFRTCPNLGLKWPKCQNICQSAGVTRTAKCFSIFPTSQVNVSGFFNSQTPARNHPILPTHPSELVSQKGSRPEPYGKLDSSHAKSNARRDVRMIALILCILYLYMPHDMPERVLDKNI